MMGYKILLGSLNLFFYHCPLFKLSLQPQYSRTNFFLFFSSLQPELILNTSAHPEGFLTLILWKTVCQLEDIKYFKNSISVPTHNFQKNRYRDILGWSKTGAYSLPPASPSFLIASFLPLFSRLSELYQSRAYGNVSTPDGYCQPGNNYHSNTNDHVWLIKWIWILNLNHLGTISDF